MKICGKRYRCLIDGWKVSGTRHCTKRKGHAGLHGKAKPVPAAWRCPKCGKRKLRKNYYQCAACGRAHSASLDFNGR